MAEIMITPQFKVTRRAEESDQAWEPIPINKRTEHELDHGMPLPAYPIQANSRPRDLAVFLKDTKGLRRVMITDLLYLEADGNYVEIHLRNGRVVLRNSMSEIMKSLPLDLFIMVNRSQAVNVLLLDNIGTDEVSMGRKSFTLTRRYRDDLLRHLNIITGR